MSAPETLPCIRDDCDRVVLPEEDHVRIEGHLIHTDDRDRQDTYYAHHDS
jgi:hypothetical protein